MENKAKKSGMDKRADQMKKMNEELTRKLVGMRFRDKFITELISVVREISKSLGSYKNLTCTIFSYNTTEIYVKIGKLYIKVSDRVDFVDNILVTLKQEERGVLSLKSVKNGGSISGDAIKGNDELISSIRKLLMITSNFVVPVQRVTFTVGDLPRKLAVKAVSNKSNGNLEAVVNVE